MWGRTILLWHFHLDPIWQCQLNAPLMMVTLFIAIPSKYRCDNCDIFPAISGNFFNLEQPEIIKTSRDSKLILDRRLSRDLQPLRSNRRSCLRSPRDVWILDNLVQCWRIKCWRFGTPLKSGVSIKFQESRRSMSFNLFALCYKTTIIQIGKIKPLQTYIYYLRKLFCIGENLTLIPFYRCLIRP